MRHMTIHTVFRDVCVFKDERTLKFHMTTGAGLFGGRPLQHLVQGGAMRFMAIDAGHLVLGNRMMRKLFKCRPDVRMTFETKFVHFRPAEFLLRAQMQFMAIEATDIIVGVGTGIPVSQYRSRGG